MFYRAVAATCPGNNKDYNSNNIYLNTKYITDDIKASEVLLKQKKEQEGLQFYGIAEGFGAENFADEASLIAIKKLSALQKKVADDAISDNYDEAADVVYSYLDEFIKSANEAVSAKAGELSETNIFASVAVMGLYETAAITCNLGNTRIYLFRKGHLSRLSEDHNYAQMMYKNGVITADKVSSHPKKKKLTQYLGIMPDDKQPEPYYSEVEVKHGDIFVICSSSFCDSIEDAAICDIIKDSKSLSQIAEKLMQSAAEKGFTEDTSVMVIRADEHQNVGAPVADGAAVAAGAAGTAAVAAAGKTAANKANAAKPVKDNDFNPTKRSFMDKMRRFLGLTADSENEKIWPAILTFGCCILVVIILVVLGIKIFQASRSPSGGTQQPSAIIGTPSTSTETPSNSTPTPQITATNNPNTSAPTQSPTAAPQTQSPTQAPTAAPTPTTKPTDKPTDTPATATPETPTETPATATPETPTETPATPTPETPTETPATPTPETPTVEPSEPATQE